MSDELREGAGESFDLASITIPASKLHGPQRLLSSGIAALDRACGGGLPLGSLVEWGLPPGKDGQRVIVQFLLQRTPLTLWIFADEHKMVYPPAWSALGVDLEQMYFVSCKEALRLLQPVFLEPLFEVIVFDRPAYLSPGDCAFLAMQARKMQQLIVILRPYELRAQQGNAHMRMRANAFYDFSSGQYGLTAVKGMKCQRLNFSLPSAVPMPR
jgi:hypothetical protein